MSSAFVKANSAVPAKRGLTRKAYLNSVAAGVDTGARMLVALVTTPILVTFLGEDAFGIWKVLQRMVGYFGDSSGTRPTHMTLRNVVASLQCSDDSTEKRQSVGSALLIWLLFLPFQLAGGLLVVWYAPTWLHVAPDTVAVVRVAAVILLAQLGVLSLTSIPIAVLEGENQAHQRIFMSAPLLVLGGALVAIAAIRHTGIVGVAWAVLIGSAISGLAFLGIARAHVSWFGLAWPSRENLTGFFQLNGWFLAWRFIRKLMTSSDVVILGTLATPALVTSYTLTRQVPEMLLNITAMLGTGAGPGLGAILASGDYRRVSALRGELMLLTWLATCSVGTTIILWNEAFIQLWVGPEFYGGQTPTVLIVVMVTQFVIMRNDANIIDLTLDLQRKVILGLLSACLSLATGAILVWSGWGIEGLCIGFIFGRLLLNICYPTLLGAALKISLAEQLSAAWRPALLTAVLYGAAAMCGSMPRVANWIHFGSGVLISFALITACLLLVGISGAQREALRDRVRKVLNRRTPQ